MFSATNLFSKFGISSPSLWWNKNEMIELEKTFAKHNEKLNARVFISVGSLEGSERTMAFADSIISHNYKGLTTQIFDGEAHMSVVPASISRILRVLYSKKKK